MFLAFGVDVIKREEMKSDEIRSELDFYLVLKQTEKESSGDELIRITSGNKQRTFVCFTFDLTTNLLMFS